MSQHDHQVLCGALRKVKPKKVLEVGVAEGGTTAVLVNCLSMLDIESELWSVDLNEKLYCNAKQDTGYVYAELKKYIKIDKIRHQFCLGGTIADYIDKIGDGIDFAVIDTTHKLPGELIDFLCIFPYLRENATVVLHDVDLNFLRAVYGNKNQILLSKESIATKVLFSTIAADKYLCWDHEKLPNIAVLHINGDTKKYIGNVFYALTMTWAYMPADQILERYRQSLKKHYNQELLRYYDIAVSNNQRIYERTRLAKIMDDQELLEIRYEFPYSQIPKKSRIVIYGAGKVGCDIYAIQSMLKDYSITAWVDKNFEKLDNHEIKPPQFLKNCEFDFIVVAVEKISIFQEICSYIIEKGLGKEEQIIGPIVRY
jgi:predicted O-methyltransferase YrrM